MPLIIKCLQTKEQPFSVFRVNQSPHLLPQKLLEYEEIFHIIICGYISQINRFLYIDINTCKHEILSVLNIYLFFKTSFLTIFTW